jgi:hypothetical protein
VDVIRADFDGSTLVQFEFDASHVGLDEVFLVVRASLLWSDRPSGVVEVDLITDAFLPPAPVSVRTFGYNRTSYETTGSEDLTVPIDTPIGLVVGESSAFVFCDNEVIPPGTVYLFGEYIKGSENDLAQLEFGEVVIRTK